MRFANATKLHRKSGGAKPTCPGVPWRDLQFAQPGSDADQSATLPLVIPSEAEGSAFSPDQHPMLTRALLPPLSSRAKPRDLRFRSTSIRC
jgi:hypothetical protein